MALAFSAIAFVVETIDLNRVFLDLAGKEPKFKGGIAMSVAQQGAYLATTLAGFVAFTAGLAARASHHRAGVVVALAGVVLLIASAAGFYRIKRSR